MLGIGKCYTIYREIASKKLPKENPDWVWEEKYWDIEKLEEKTAAGESRLGTCERVLGYRENVEDKTFGSFPRHSLYKDYLNVTVTV